MDASALQALLETAARELSEVVSCLPTSDGDEASLIVSHEIYEAREATEQAAAACSNASSHCKYGQGPSDVLCEARSLRAGAMCARDAAEMRLWALQDQHTELLVRLRKLSMQQQQRLDEQHAESNLAGSRQTVLAKHCEQLNHNARALRTDLEAKSQRLIASNTLGHSLERSKKKLQRQHEGSRMESLVAREVIDIQESTEAYLQQTDIEHRKVKQSLEFSQQRFSDKVQELQSEWSEQQARHHADMASLQNRLGDLQQDYEDRWRATERNARQLIETKSQQASEAGQRVVQEIVALDEERENEAIASKELAEQQEQIMSVAREAAFSEMEAKLQEKHRDMEEKVVAERHRCQDKRTRHFQRSSDCQNEILGYKRHIGELGALHCRRPQRMVPMGGGGHADAMWSPGHE